MKISKTHHVTVAGRVKRNPRTTRLVREFMKERREHPTMTDAGVMQIVRDHEAKKYRKSWRKLSGTTGKKLDFIWVDGKPKMVWAKKGRK